MKLLAYLFVITPTVLLSQTKTAEELTGQNVKKYSIKSAKIRYIISGDANGDEIMIFDSYGWKSLRTRTMAFELYGIANKKTLLEITDGDFVYRLDETDSTFTTRKDMKWSREASYKSPDQISEAILFAMGGKYSSNSTLLGKSCNVWVFEGKAIQELWVWKGLVLKRKAKLGDRLITTTASSIEVDIKPLKDIFEIPYFYKEKD